MTVTLYTKPACVQCNQTKKAFDKKGVSYEVIDVTKDENAYNYVTSLGYMQAPVVVAGEDHWSGFRPDKIQDLI